MIPRLPRTKWVAGAQGLYDLPEEIYRPALGINQSTLKHMLRSPAHCKQEMDNPKKRTPFMTIGHLAHVACLEPKLFGRDKSHYITPSVYASSGMQCPECKTITDSEKCSKCKTVRVKVSVEKEWNWNSTTCIKWRDEHKDKPIITSDEAVGLEGMRKAVLDHPIAGKLISRGVSEVAVFAKDTETGVLLKAKIDKVIEDNSKLLWVTELKKVQNAREFFSDARVRRYDIQCAMNLDILHMAGIEMAGFIFVVVEEDPPHGVMIYRPTEEFINVGRHGNPKTGAKGYRALLHEHIACLESGEWPGYPAEITELNISDWVK